MKTPSMPARRATANRQLSIAFDSARLRAISPTERATAVVQLALLLMEAAGVAAEERHDGER
jgi:hypothetical protein